MKFVVLFVVVVADDICAPTIKITPHPTPPGDNLLCLLIGGYYCVGSFVGIFDVKLVGYQLC